MIPKSGNRFSERDHAQTELERDDDSKKNHPALMWLDLEPTWPIGRIRMRLAIWCALAITTLFAALPATAAAQRDWADCKADDPDRSIAGCTRIIEARGGSPHNRAVAYDYRGVAWRN